MKFCEKLNEYIDKTGCTAKEISELSGISESTLSRYRSGERVPDVKSDAFDSLCKAVAELSRREKGEITLDYYTVKDGFLSCLDINTADREVFRKNLDTAMTVLNINASKMSAYTNYELSTIIRIRNGSRRPADPQRFALGAAEYISENADTPERLDALSSLLGCKSESISDSAQRTSKIFEWLFSEHADAEDDVSGFLGKLSEFNLNEYIKSVHFDELKVPSLPFRLHGSKSYYGIREMMEAELDFLKTTVLSKSDSPVTMYSDMPIEEIAKDSEFMKKWIFGMALLLKKGLHLNMIHNVTRPFSEMMLGLEGWIPMYMTGQISPYYLKNPGGGAFHHYIIVSGAAALSGEAVAGYQNEGKYYLTRTRDEIAYYSRRASALLQNASPLMDIYRADNAKAFAAFSYSESVSDCPRRSILSAPPIYTATIEMLKKLCEDNGVSQENREIILSFFGKKRDEIRNTLSRGVSVTDEIPIFSRDEFEKNPPSLPLADIFLDKDIKYSYDLYVEHVKRTERFAADNSGYALKENTICTFANLQIHIRQGQYVIVSKERCPAIHFVIRHPKMCRAIESFIPSFRDIEKKQS
ncbi:MAG: helix-turn-helix transcriptional regulator [Oscillospiraceae bacterium]|nr:helix-turn-helix transcriptional regulator [Oscillospiraceae bacterium]